MKLRSEQTRGRPRLYEGKASRLSNAVVALGTVARSLPQPASGLVEALLAAATAGLAAWSAHLHRSMQTLKNGKNGSSGGTKRG